MLGFVAAVTDTLLYVDDIIDTASSNAFLQRILDRLHSEFAMTDLGDLHYFLGIAITRSSTGLFLSQHRGSPSTSWYGRVSPFTDSH
jgi:hypothetical protein